MQRKHALITTAITLTLSAMPFAVARAATDKIDIVSWNQADLYAGLTAEQLFDTEVRGADGEDIGEIENLVVSADGKIDKVIVEAGGFLDIGDTHLAVPWEQVELGPNLEWVKLPVDEDNIENFSLFEGEEVKTGPRAWKASELINDYVALQDVPSYGMVQDIVFNQDGNVEAVVVYPDVAYGVGRPYAYPYYGYGYDRDFDPGAETYRLPYRMSEIQELGPFDYSAFEAPVPGAPAGMEEQQEGQEEQG
jgi:sporulation protein YlmC with PRC-barrel domain